MEKNMSINPHNDILYNYPPIYNNPFINTISLPYLYPNIDSKNFPFNTNNIMSNIKESKNPFFPKILRKMI